MYVHVSFTWKCSLPSAFTYSSTFRAVTLPQFIALYPLLPYSLFHWVAQFLLLSLLIKWHLSPVNNYLLKNSPLPYSSQTQSFLVFLLLWLFFQLCFLFPHQLFKCWSSPEFLPSLCISRNVQTSLGVYFLQASLLCLMTPKSVSLHADDFAAF